jgi:large subunit ribosomal protein L9
MKVILLQDVAKIGRRNAVVDIPNGHALNMLIPKGLALPATPDNLKKLKAKTAKADASASDKQERFQSALTLLADKKMTVSASANEKGHLFEALKPSSVVEAIKSQGASVEENQVKIEKPIKEVGDHEITLTEGGVSKVVVITVESNK